MFPSTSRREIDLPTEMNLFGLELMSYTARPKAMLVYNENAHASSALALKCKRAPPTFW
jgi:hypothetical protein